MQLAELEKEKRILLSNLAKNKGTLKNYNSVIGEKGIGALPKSIIETIREQELVIESVQSNLDVIERKIVRIKNENYDEQTLQRAFKNYVNAVKTLSSEKRRRKLKVS